MVQPSSVAPHHTHAPHLCQLLPLDVPNHLLRIILHCLQLFDVCNLLLGKLCLHNRGKQALFKWHLIKWETIGMGFLLSWLS